jgi:hypothetical protein
MIFNNPNNRSYFNNTISDRILSNLQTCIDTIGSNLFCLNINDCHSRISYIFNQFVSCILSLADFSCFASFLKMSREKKFEVLSESIVVGFITSIFSPTFGKISSIIYFANKTRPVSVNEKLSDCYQSGLSYFRSAHYYLDKFSTHFYRSLRNI